jgi:hypothetical protein
MQAKPTRNQTDPITMVSTAARHSAATRPLMVSGARVAPLIVTP